MSTGTAILLAGLWIYHGLIMSAPVNSDAARYLSAAIAVIPTLTVVIKGALA